MLKKRQRQNEIPLSFLLLPDEKQRYLEYLRSKFDTLQGRKRMLIVDILLNAGLRASELCNLRIKHLPGVIGANVIEVYRGKGNKDRTIPISQRLADSIADYIKCDRGRTMPRHRLRSDPNGWLFFNQCKRQFKYHALYQMVRRSAVRAGIAKRIRPHKLRHSFATNQLESGTPITDLSLWLGHTDLRVTQRYLHVTGKRQFEYAEAADQK